MTLPAPSISAFKALLTARSVTPHLTFKTREEAKQLIFEYIEVFYNQKRTHSANDYYFPVVFENMMKLI